MKVLRNSEGIEKIKKRNLWALFFIALIYGFSSSQFFIVYQPFLLEITGSIFITGILITLGGIIIFLPMPWVGKLSDRYNRKKIWLFDVPLAILGLIFLIFAKNLMFLVAGIVFYFMSEVIGEISHQIYVSESSDKSKKGLSFGFMFFGMFGGQIGGTFFVMLGIVQEVRIYFIIYIIFSLFNYIIIIFGISNPIPNGNQNHIIRPENPHKRQNIWSNIFKTPKIKVVIVFFTLDLFIYNISLSIYSAGLRAQYNLTYEQIAFTTIWFSISNMIFQIPGGHLADKIGKKRALIVSEFFGLGYFFIFISAFILWSTGFDLFLIPLLVIGAILHGLSVSTFVPSQQMILTDLDETRKAESYGIINFIKGIGFMPTGIIGGFLVENISYVTPFIITFIGILFEIWFLFKFFHD